MASKKQRSVLLVEDDPELRPLLSQALLEEGHCVQAFDTAAKALAHFRTGAHIDVVVTDLQLPNGIDGATMIQNLVAEGFEGPVLCISAHPKAPASESASGQLRLLCKPFGASEFLTVFDFLFQ